MSADVNTAKDQQRKWLQDLVGASKQEEKRQASEAKYKKRTEELAASGTKWLDPLAADPRIANLLAQRKSELANLMELERKPDENQKEIEAKKKAVAEIDQEIEEAQKQLNAEGIAPRQRGAEYADEEAKQGMWRTTRNATRVIKPLERQENESDLAFAVREEEFRKREVLRKQELEKKANSDQVTTRMFTDDERENSKVDIIGGELVGGERFDAHGAAAGGTLPLGAGAREFVMGRDGQMHQFAPKQTKENDKQVNTHHSSVLRGEEVAGAGKMETENGKIKTISNASGHYKPGIAQMVQTLEILLKQGVFLNQEWTDENGDEPSKEADEVINEYRKLLKSTETSRIQLETIKKQYETITAKIDSLQKSQDDRELKRIEQKANELETTAKELEGTVRQLSKELETAAKALGKLGLAPSNRAFGPKSDSEPQTKVAFIDGAEKMDGLGVRDKETYAKDNASSVKDFLMSGGGDENTSKDKLTAKNKVLNELTEKLKAKRTDLDENALRQLDELRAKVQSLPDIARNNNLPEEKQKQLEESRKQCLALLNEPDLATKDQIEERLKAIKESIEQTLETILTPHQKKRYEYEQWFATVVDDAEELRDLVKNASGKWDEDLLFSHDKIIAEVEQFLAGIENAKKSLESFDFKKADNESVELWLMGLPKMEEVDKLLKDMREWYDAWREMEDDWLKEKEEVKKNDELEKAQISTLKQDFDSLPEEQQERQIALAILEAERLAIYDKREKEYTDMRAPHYNSGHLRQDPDQKRALESLPEKIKEGLISKANSDVNDGTLKWEL